MQTVVVTGGSEGTGKCAAIELAKRGANVIIVSRNVQKLKVAYEDIKVCIFNYSIVWRVFLIKRLGCCFQSGSTKVFLC